MFYVENALKMRSMWTLENYADPHHRILSDAL